MILYQDLFKHWCRHISADLNDILRLCQFTLQRFGKFAWPVTVSSMRIELKKKRASEITGAAVGNGWILGTDYPVGSSPREINGSLVFFIATSEKQQRQISINLNKE